MNAKTYSITYKGNGHNADGKDNLDRFTNRATAIKEANFLARRERGETDFIGGQFEVWKDTENGGERVHKTAIITDR